MQLTIRVHQYSLLQDGTQKAYDEPELPQVHSANGGQMAWAVTKLLTSLVKGA